jgi:hypothetical protein
MCYVLIMPSENNNKKMGPPFGNQNARKHGFYSKQLSADDQNALNEAVGMTGLDAEIALLRVKIKAIEKTGNYDLLIDAFSALTRMLKAKRFIPEGGGLKEAIAGAVADLSASAGLVPVMDSTGKIHMFRSDPSRMVLEEYNGEQVPKQSSADDVSRKDV